MCSRRVNKNLLFHILFSPKKILYILVRHFILTTVFYSHFHYHHHVQHSITQKKSSPGLPVYFTGNWSWRRQETGLCSPGPPADLETVDRTTSNDDAAATTTLLVVTTTAEYAGGNNNTDNMNTSTATRNSKESLAN